jgi:hypothetical protein
MHALLQTPFVDHPPVGEIRGSGLVGAAKFVARKARRPGSTHLRPRPHHPRPATCRHDLLLATLRHSEDETTTVESLPQEVNKVMDRARRSGPPERPSTMIEENFHGQDERRLDWPNAGRDHSVS